MKYVWDNKGNEEDNDNGNPCVDTNEEVESSANTNNDDDDIKTAAGTAVHLVPP